MFLKDADFSPRKHNEPIAALGTSPSKDYIGKRAGFSAIGSKKQFQDEGILIIAKSNSQTQIHNSADIDTVS